MASKLSDKNNGVLSCEVCGKPILEKDPFKLLDGYRHRKGCGPGTKPWIDKFGNSEINAMLAKKTKKAPTPKKTEDVILAAVREFCGRVKYMVHMDSVNKHVDCQWAIEAVIGGKKVAHHHYQGTIDPDLLYRQILLTQHNESR